MLLNEYSADLKWESASVSSTIVAADVVSMDSELPLKSRDSISRANGDLPKMGMKLYKGEKLISDIGVMASRGASEKEIVAKLFDDVPKCQKGIYEKVEYCFLQGVSDGVTLVADSENVGIGVRVDFGYKDENKFGATIKWGKTGYAPLTDINNVLSKAQADGNQITLVMIGLSAYNHIRTSDEGKQFVANFKNMVITSAALLPIPTKAAFNEAMESEYGFKFMVVDRNIKMERNGVRTNHKPFNANKVVFLTSDKVGKLVYGTLAEKTNPVAGVQYVTVDDYILLSKYSKNDPLREFTSSQALVLPVIENVDTIYVLDSQEADEISSTETEGDTNITIWDKDYVKSEVITGLATIGIVLSATATDAQVIATINTLSNKKIADLKALLTSYPKVTPATLTFTNAADATGKVISVSTPGIVTATASETWCDVAVATNKVTVTIEANLSTARTANVVVTQNGKSVTVVVSQAAAA